MDYSMEEYFSKARELGEMILASEYSKTLAEWRNRTENDPEAMDLLNTYSAYQNGVQEGMEQNTFSKEDMDEAANKLQELGTILKSHPVVGQLIKAENGFNHFVNRVMDVFRSTIMGIESCDCDGGCADGCDDGCGGYGCGGCGHNH